MKKRNGNGHCHGLPWIAVRRFVALALALILVAPANVVSVFAEGTQSGGKAPVCGLEAHAHTGACYEKALACGETEREPVTQARQVYVGNLKAHTHTKACYSHGKLACGTVEKAYFHEHNKYCRDENGELVCGLKEKRNDHEHTDKCYEKVRKLACGKKASEGHRHGQKCYEKTLVCGKKEGKKHKHTKACYEKTLVCGKKKGEGAHRHDKKCYETRRGQLTCQKGEYRIVDGLKLRVPTLKSSKKDWTTETVVVDEGHKHTDACYEKTLTCGKEEHAHSDACYGNIYAYEIREDGVSGYFSRIDGTKVTNSLIDGNVPPPPTPDGETPPPDGIVPAVPEKPEDIPERRSGTPVPRFEAMGDEALEGVLNMFGYGTPLYGMLGTGDSIPAWVWICLSIGLLALALAILPGRRRKRTD